MDEFVNAIIRLKVPKWQIGQDIRVFFSDSMVAHGKVEENNYIKRDAVLYYVESHIHEIITESGIDKNAHTNRVLRAIVNGIKTMPPYEEVEE